MQARRLVLLAASAAVLATLSLPSATLADDPYGTEFHETRVTACAPALHAEPDANSRIVTYAGMGDQVTITETRGGWVRVGLDDGREAWMRLSDTAGLTADVRPLWARDEAWLTSSASLHRYPRTGAPVVGRLAAEERVDVLLECEGWVRVRSGGQEGWIPERLLMYTPPQRAPVARYVEPTVVVVETDLCDWSRNPSATDARFPQCQNERFSFSERYGLVGGPRS